VPGFKKTTNKEPKTDHILVFWFAGYLICCRFIDIPKIEDAPHVLSAGYF
jgi:hypothetical protein